LIQLLSSSKRLAVLLRDIRFSDKPAECSPCTFSVDMSAVCEDAKKLIGLAEQYSLLIHISKGQKDKNSMKIDEKYQLNPLLAPLWDLPVARRGTIALTASEANAIFSGDDDEKFVRVSKTRVGRMTAPFFGKARGKRQRGDADEASLFDL
jgi:hypothetical protein